MRLCLDELSSSVRATFHHSNGMEWKTEQALMHSNKDKERSRRHPNGKKVDRGNVTRERDAVLVRSTQLRVRTSNVAVVASR